MVRSHEEAELLLAADLERLWPIEGLLIYSKLHKGLIRIGQNSSPPFEMFRKDEARTTLG
jgi:hypothetical protein